ncbi:MAG: hypothetical protein JWN25_1167 [Verrucomicrobiales bacterium]|nr:hypothetical protein [Verrucomicrobiales bacterium]
MLGRRRVRPGLYMAFLRPSTDLIERLALNPDLAKGLRAAISILVPLLVFHSLGRSGEALFVAMAALNLSLPDLRGAYGVRLTLLATMLLVAASSVVLGAMAASMVASAAVFMFLIVLLSCLWRHLSSDYGPFLGVSSALLFLLGLAQGGGFTGGLHLARLVCIGGVFATLLHVTLWIFRPLYPLRYAVAETWVAASNLVGEVRNLLAKGSTPSTLKLSNSEAELRLALDRTFLILGSVDAKKSPQFLLHLEEMRRQVVHFAMRVVAINTSLEPLLQRPEVQRSLPALDSVLKSLGDTARSAGISTLLYRSDNFAATEIRLRRSQHLIEVLLEQLGLVAPGDFAMAQLKSSLTAMIEVLPKIRHALAATTDSGPGRFALPANLPELGTRSIRSLSAWISPAERIDPVLVRYAARMTVLSVFAVILYKWFQVPRGYWIAFTIIVVMQPDYGSTRKKAAERILGTLFGSLLGSVFLFIHPPFVALAIAAAASGFAFAYYLRLRYDRAVFFVTLLLVLIIETTGPLEIYFTSWRFVSTLAGGLLALLGSRIFWPVWEGEQFPLLLVAAIRANRDYLQSLFPVRNADPKTLLRPMLAKRKAENANRFTAASLEKLMGEPESRRNKIESASALTTYNQRVTRALNILALHLGTQLPDPQRTPPVLVEAISGLLESLALVLENANARNQLDAMDRQFQIIERTSGGAQLDHNKFSSEDLIQTQLAKTLVEVRAMSLALKPSEANHEQNELVENAAAGISPSSGIKKGMAVKPSH